MAQIILKRPKLGLQKINSILAFLFYIIWILVGLFFLLTLFASWRQGAFKDLLNPRPVANTQPQQIPQIPKEADLPGVGKVNVSCVEQALKPEVIEKIFTDGNPSRLTAEEKAKLEPCIVDKSTPSPSKSP